jgi:BlaI family transcriptional regulator, penicillinase repressor
MRLTDSEWEIMKVVWNRVPASARDVLEVLEPKTSWAYTTVKTLMNRMVEKGILKARLRANTTLYEPLVSREEARRSAVSVLVDKAFDGAFGPLMHFLVSEERLSEEDRREVLRLLESGPASGSSHDRDAE